MSVSVFQKTPNGPQRVEMAGKLELAISDILWVDMVEPDQVEEAAVEAAFGIDAPSEAERASLEESARFYLENNTLVMNATVMARIQPEPKMAKNSKHSAITHHRQIVSFFLTSASLITVRACHLRAFEINAGRASANLADDQSGADVFVSLLESLVERAADYMAASATELEDLNMRVLIGHKQVRLETILRRLGQMGAGASQTRDSLASLSRLIRFALGHVKTFNIPLDRLDLLATDIETLQRQS
jgi:magnesium transporter